MIPGVIYWKIKPTRTRGRFQVERIMYGKKDAFPGQGGFTYGGVGDSGPDKFADRSPGNSAREDYMVTV